MTWQQAPLDLEAAPIQRFAAAPHSQRKRTPPLLLEWVILALYTVVVACAIPYHEPWADEAQAWQLARSLSLPALFHTYIRYEGSPGLWHFVLWILNKVHIGYAGMHWFSGLLAVAATAVLVLRSPFPRYLKFSLPFTYFLLFQYAVIARNYVLVPGLLYLIASRWKKSPAVMALLLGLLANVALHAAVISAGLAIVYAIDNIRPGDLRDPAYRRNLRFATLILLGLYAFALWTAWPPHDLLLARVRGPSRSFSGFAIASLVWGMCEPWPLSFLFWIAVALCLHARRSLFCLLPVLCFACFSGAVYANFWHVGLLTPLLLCLLWITWPGPECHVSPSERIGRVALILMTATQILWSGYALAYDHAQAYSPDLATAQFLKPLIRSGASIAVTYLDEPTGNQAFDAVGILPYFGHNIYSNQPESFWNWSSHNPTEAQFFTALRSHPQILLVEERMHGNAQIITTKAPKLELLTRSGYRMTNLFCGRMPERFEFRETSCHLIFQRPAAPVESSRRQAPRPGIIDLKPEATAAPPVPLIPIR
jgi:hypothetical protein